MTPFPLHTIPDPLRSFVSEGAEALDCDGAFIAVPLLPIVASAIGNTRRIRLKKSWTEPAVIWAAPVGESGTVKSPALDLARRPLERRQRRILRSYAESVKEHEAELAGWKKLPKSERGDEPATPPPPPHPLCIEITTEALAVRLLHTPRGTCVAPDELGVWFGSFNQYKNSGSDVSHWLAMHGARALKVDRKVGDRPTIYIPHAAVCVTGTIQPATLRRALIPAFYENGLAARLLVAMPEARAKRWTDAEISDQTQSVVDSLFDNLFEFRSAPGVDGDDEPRMVDLMDGALSKWKCFVNEHNAEMMDLSGNPRAAWAKLEGYAARFALLFHCIREATGDKQSVYIDSQDIDSGIELARWFGAETLRVYRALAQTDEERERDELIGWIASKGGRVTVRDVQHGPRRYRNDPDQAEPDLMALVDEGRGTWQHIRSSQVGGRPTDVFCLADSPDFPIAKPGAGTTTPKNTEESEVLVPVPANRDVELVQLPDGRWVEA